MGGGRGGVKDRVRVTMRYTEVHVMMPTSLNLCNITNY